MNKFGSLSLYTYTLGSYCDFLGTRWKPRWKLLGVFGHMSYYWCHTCSDRVPGSVDNSGEPTCGNCGDTFVEELEEGGTSEALGSSQRDENVSRDGDGPSSEQQQAQRQDRGGGGGSAAGSQPQEIWLPLGSIFGEGMQNQQQRGGTRESASGGQTDLNPDVSAAITQLLSRLINPGAHSAEAGGGGGNSARVQRLGGGPMELAAMLGGEFITLNSTGGLAGTIGDYAIGDIDRIIEQLIDPNQVSLRLYFGTWGSALTLCTLICSMVPLQPPKRRLILYLLHAWRKTLNAQCVWKMHHQAQQPLSCHVNTSSTAGK